MGYSNKVYMDAAYDQWLETLPSDKHATDLRAALDNWDNFAPCDSVQLAINAAAGHPAYEQVRRDRRIVDYLVTCLGYTHEAAINLWADWEDYEYELIDEA